MGKTSFGLLLLAAACMPGVAAAAETAQPAGAPAPRFQRADTDGSGDVSPAEFAAANDPYVGKADANGDGRMTADEIAERIVRLRAQRTAERIVKRLDTDGDGAVSQAELQAGQAARFARLDKNGDGKLTADEMPGRKGRRPAR